MVLVVGHCLRQCVPRCLRTNSRTITASSAETSSSEIELEGGSCGVRRRRSSSTARQSSGISSDDDESFINFTLIGPPGSGKGTYGSMVADKLGVQFVSMGDVLRRHVKHETEIGRAVQTYKHKGKLVPDDIVVLALRQEELNWWQRTKEEHHKERNATSKVGFILDGFPRTVAQAKLITPSLSMGSSLSSGPNVSDFDGGNGNNYSNVLPFQIHYAIHIDVPLNICLKKIMGRRTCSKCGRSINTCDIRPEVDDGFCMPPMLPPINTTDATTEETCSPRECSKYWDQRADDTQHDVVEHRLEEYHIETSPVLDYYKSMNGRLLSFQPYSGLKDVGLLTNLIMQNACA